MTVSARRELRIAVSGASGLIGSELACRLRADELRVLRLVRRPQQQGQDDILWDPVHGAIDGHLFDGVGAVVHLAGENIASHAWSSRQKRVILESRVEGTRLLAGTLARLPRKPDVLVCASAIGFYGDRAEPVDESAGFGKGFLAELCRQWEAAAAPAAKAGIRTVLLRFGVVLSPKGGALAKMLTPFRLGLGGPVGSGRQPMSWVSIDDAVGAIRFALETPSLSGPLNVSAPNPVTNAEFGKALGRALGRPALMPLPAFMVRAIFGEMGEALLLGGARALPKKLQAAGYRFVHPELGPALRDLLAR